MAGTIDKKDLDIILEVNKKSIEIETEVAEQNEEIIGLLNKSIDGFSKLETSINNKVQSLDSSIKSYTSDIKKEIESKIIENQKETKEVAKDIFQLKILLASGLLTLVVQLVQMIMKK